MTSPRVRVCVVSFLWAEIDTEYPEVLASHGHASKVSRMGAGKYRCIIREGEDSEFFGEGPTADNVGVLCFVESVKQGV